MELISEIILVIAIITNIILAIFIHKNAYKIAKILNLFLIVITLSTTIYIQADVFKLMTLISASLVMLTSNQIIVEKRNRSFEFFAIFLAGILGAFCLINSKDFISAFVSIELLGICCYFLTAFRKNHKSKESALKYLITGASASTLFLLGTSYLYGITGQINFGAIQEILTNSGINLFFVCSFLLILAGTLFKLGCLPFINWVADVFEGANYSTCLYFSLIPKIAAIAFLSTILTNILSFCPVVLIITASISLLTIIYASIAAINQTNIKRLYAYSSIIHAGFILLGLSVMSQYALSTVIFYIFTYIFMNTGIWYASLIYNNELQSDNIEDYKGLFKKHPYFSIALIVCLLSLAGLPPTSGFLAKVYLFSGISRANIIWVVILLLGMIASVISMFAYLKIIKQLFLNTKTEISINKQQLASKIILYLCAIITILLCLFPDSIIKISQISAFIR